MRCLERVTSFCSKQLAATIVMGAALTGSVFAQDTLPVSTGDVQWTAYGSDLASSKYVALEDRKGSIPSS
jgi:hypothetical protein